MKIAVVYFSQTGSTAQLASAVIGGLYKTDREQALDVLEHRIQGEEIIDGRFQNQVLLDDLSDCSAIIFGSPTYMGSVAAQFKAFADATSELWVEQQWAGKLAAGFTCGSAMNGDQGFALQYMATLASQQGMLWLGLDVVDVESGINRLGCQTGVTAVSKDGITDPRDLETATYLGERVAEFCRRLTAGRA